MNDSVEVSSESGSVNTDVVEETIFDHENKEYVNPRGVRFTPHKQPKEGKYFKFLIMEYSATLMVKSASNQSILISQ